MEANRKKRKLDSDENIRNSLEKFLLNSDSEDDFSEFELGRFSSDEESENEDNFHPSQSPVLSTCAGTSEVPVTHNWNEVKPEEDIVVELDSITEFSGQQCVIGFEGLSEYKCFQKFFPDSIFDIVARETNLYAKECLEKVGALSRNSRYRKWCEIDAKDIKAFVALEIGMGLVRKLDLSLYFQESYWLTSTPGFGHIFSRNDYQLIRSFLHFSNNELADKGDRLAKIRPVLNEVKDLYGKSFYPNKELSVDEKMMKFKGRLFFKQYLPSKPSSKWGVKLWSLCDSKTGFLLNFDVYTGKENANKSEKGLAYDVVMKLIIGYEGKGHIIYMDNFYSSVPLFDDLRIQNIGACGTVRTNKKYLPPAMKTFKGKRGSVPKIWLRSDEKMLSCIWQDTGKVSMISTVGDTGVKNVTINSKAGKRDVIKPSVQVLYNKYMGGVDKFDQLCSTYPFNRKSKKWYQTLWHFTIEAALVNGYICYRIQNPDKKNNTKKI